MEGQASVVAMDMTGSVALQKLLPFASVAQVGQVLSILGGEAGSGFKDVSCDRCGGHVMESALRQMSRWTGEAPRLKSLDFNPKFSGIVSCFLRLCVYYIIFTRIFLHTGMVYIVFCGTDEVAT